jgi:hypothetical protein
MPVWIKKAKIALLDIDLRKHKLPMGVQVVINDPKKIKDIRDRCGPLQFLHPYFLSLYPLALYRARTHGLYHMSAARTTSPRSASR